MADTSSEEARRPSMSTQLGLSSDPNRLNHSVSPSGARVTRYESSQPGFPTYHRRIANPVPLVFLAIGAFFILYGALLCEVRGLRNWQIIINVGLPLCGPGLMAAAMFSFAEGNTFLATLSGSLSGILAGSSLVFLPWTGIQTEYTMAGYPQPSTATATLDQAVGMVWLISLIPVFILLVGSVRTAFPISITLTFVLLAFILQGASLLSDGGNIALQKAAGAMFFIAGIVSWYVCTSVLLLEEKVKILPVFPLPRVD